MFQIFFMIDFTKYSVKKKSNILGNNSYITLTNVARYNS